MSGGLGVKGRRRSASSSDAGGTIIGLEDSCNYLIHELSLPVKNVLAGLKTSEFYGPGSIVGAEMTESGRRCRARTGIPSRSSGACRSGSRSISTARSPSSRPHGDVTPLAPLRRRPTPLESGWLHGAGKIQGKAALARVRVGGAA